MATLESDKKKALGRGLASLIPDAVSASPEKKEGAPALTPKKEFFLCDIEKIVPNTYQPRKIFSKEDLEELTESVKAVGIIQPITVRQKDGAYEIIAGERRWRAAQRAGLKQVPVIVKDSIEDVKSLQMALIENVQRANLNCIEEAIAYQQLMDEFQLSQEEISAKVGKNRATVANTMRLLKLPSVIREDLTAGKLTMGHARALLALDSAQDQLAVRELVIKKKLSVRDTERKVAEVVRSKGKPNAGGKSADPNLVALEDDLRREYGTPVRVIGNMQKGMIQLTYNTAQDLLRITDRMKGYLVEYPNGEVAFQSANGEVAYVETEIEVAAVQEENAPLPEVPTTETVNPEGTDVSPQV